MQEEKSEMTSSGQSNSKLKEEVEQLRVDLETKKKACEEIGSKLEGLKEELKKLDATLGKFLFGIVST